MAWLRRDALRAAFAAFAGAGVRRRRRPQPLRLRLRPARRASRRLPRAALAAFRRRGVRVRRVLTDNAKAYTVARSFHGAAAAADVRLSHTRPYRPQTNGKAERSPRYTPPGHTGCRRARGRSRAGRCAARRAAPGDRRRSPRRGDRGARAWRPRAPRRRAPPAPSAAASPRRRRAWRRGCRRRPPARRDRSRPRRAARCDRSRGSRAAPGSAPRRAPPTRRGAAARSL